MRDGAIEPGPGRAAQSTPWWRRFPFRTSVRGLILATFVIGAGLGWLTNRAHTQRDAVAAIRGAGGRVLYDWQWQGGREVPKGQSRWPAWLVDRLGTDFFDHAVYADLARVGSDAELAHVARLPRLEVLRLARSTVTDAGLAHLEGLTRLQLLALDDTRVTNAGLTHLRGLTHLQTLTLGLTEITDAGLTHLKGLTQLKVLSLSLTRVSDSGARGLRGALPKTAIAAAGWPGTAQGRALELHEALVREGRDR